MRFHAATHIVTFRGFAGGWKRIQFEMNSKCVSQSYTNIFAMTVSAMCMFSYVGFCKANV